MASSIRSATRPRDWHLLLLIAGILVISWGLWDAPVPAGDEGIHILQGINLAEHGRLSPNLYYMAYAWLFRAVTDDPVIAHVLLRLFVALAATIGLYYVLTAFKSISHLAAVLACLFWTASSFITPLYQSGNINGFAFALILPGIAILLRYPTVAGLLAFLLFAVWSALVRPEYYASLAAVGMCGIAMIIANRTPASTPWRVPMIGITLSVSVLLAASAWVVLRGTAPGGGFDQYLLQGLGQSYAVFYKQRHPEERFEPMTEYQPVLDRVFGNPNGFFEAVHNNPSEALRYFVISGAQNLRRVIPALTRSQQPLKSAFLRVILVAGTLIGLARLLRSPSTSPSLAPPRLAAYLRLLTLFAVTTASSVAIVLLIPDPRYWISWAPLTYLWLAWSIDQLLNIPVATWYRRGAIAAVLVILSIPTLAWSKSNQELIYMVRQAVKEGPEKPVIAGIFVAGWAAILFRGKATAVNNYNGLSPEDLRQGRYDILMADGLARTARWQSELAFLKSFQATPEAYGYRQIVLADGSATSFYVRTRKASE